MVPAGVFEKQGSHGADDPQGRRTGSCSLTSGQQVKVFFFENVAAAAAAAATGHDEWRLALARPK